MYSTNISCNKFVQGYLIDYFILIEPTFSAFPCYVAYAEPATLLTSFAGRWSKPTPKHERTPSKEGVLSWLTTIEAVITAIKLDFAR